ncbi:vasculin-like protein 1 isoform X2 [Limulus polyphemus]|uniref:Vasculin-like protein 1 isoform X2 n=1 Tax=Limulus polyphemus TaxID=6850 RepID=A0ABM1BN51_LIMPO|nr:vasculin-like protein 1 isoform X2 [Limulus polyphemus]
MASNNAPTHDFAPAWLKIPLVENTRPLGSDSEREGHISRREEHRASYGRRPRESDQPRLHETGRDQEGKRKSYFLPRHHPVDSDDDTQHYFNSRQFGSGSSVSHSAQSQPSVLRRPHSRHDFRDPSYHSKYGFSHHGESAEGFGNVKAKSKQLVSSSGPNMEAVNGKGKGVSGNNFHQEFPSLHGESADVLSTQPPQVNGGVWKNPRNAKVHGTIISKKIHLVQRPIKTDLGVETQSTSPSGVSTLPGNTANSLKPNSLGSVVSQGSKTNDSTQARCSLFKPLVPAAKQTSQVKKPNRDGVRLSSKEPMTNGLGITRSSSATSTSQPLSNSGSRSKSTPTPPPHMEILIKNPKTRGNKGEFLKALQSEEGGRNELYQKNDNHQKRSDEDFSQLHDDRETCVNGINIEKVSFRDEEESEDVNILSSSLEAEERLLREMGWKEECLDDDDYAPLTEEELQEFHDLTQKLQVNERKNGIQRNFHLNWSPKRVPAMANVVLPVDADWSSSSDSDSD